MDLGKVEKNFIKEPGGEWIRSKWISTLHFRAWELKEGNEKILST